MPRKRMRSAPRSGKTNQQKKAKTARRRFIQIRKMRSDTFVFGVIFVSELFVAPKKDRYIFIALIKWELRIGRFYG